MTALLAVGQSSAAGIITAVATALIAVGGVITALGVAVPLLRTSRDNSRKLVAQEAKLDVIHTLVNSTLTAAKQSELDGARRELVMMLELTAMQERDGTPASPDRLAGIGALRRRIDDLTSTMADRAEQTRAADIQIATEAARARDQSR